MAQVKRLERGRKFIGIGQPKIPNPTLLRYFTRATNLSHASCPSKNPSLGRLGRLILLYINTQIPSSSPFSLLGSFNYPQRNSFKFSF